MIEPAAAASAVLAAALDYPRRRAADLSRQLDAHRAEREIALRYIRRPLVDKRPLPETPEGYRVLVLPCDHCGQNYCPCVVGDIAEAIAQSRVETRHARAVADARRTDAHAAVAAARNMPEVA